MRAPGELNAFGLAKCGLKRLGHFVEITLRGPDFVTVFRRRHVLGTRFECCVEHCVGIARLDRIGDLAEAVERVTDCARCADVAAVFRYRCLDVGRGAIAVVGQGFDDERDAAGAKAFVADFLIIRAVALGRIIDRPFDIVFGHAARARRDYGRAEACVHRRIGQAGFCRNSDFAAEL